MLRLSNIKTGKIKGEFITVMLASQRAKGINIDKQPIVKTEHGAEWQFIMALHINDTVSIENDRGREMLYRVQKLDTGINRIMFRLATASTLDNKKDELHLTINQDNFANDKIHLHRVNAIGFPIQ